MGAVAAIGSRLFLDESRGPRKRLDVPGLVLISVGAAALVWALTRTSQDGRDGATWEAFVVGAVLIAAFLAWEARATDPMIPLTLFRTRGFSAATATQFLLSSSTFSAVFVVSQFFQFALGNSPLGTGLRFLPWTAAPLFVAPIAGALSDRIGTRPLMVPGLLLQAAGFAWVVVLAGTTSGFGGYVAPFLVAGLGIALVVPCVTASGLGAVPPAALGTAAGVLNTSQQFGAAFGIAIITTVFDSAGGLTGHDAVVNGFRPALAVSAGLSVLAAVAACGVPGRGDDHKATDVLA